MTNPSEFSPAEESLTRLVFLQTYLALERLQEQAPEEERAEVLAALRPLRHQVVHEQSTDDLDEGLRRILAYFRANEGTSLGSAEAHTIRLLTTPEEIADVVLRTQGAEKAPRPRADRPVALGSGPRARFAADLREARSRAGSASIRDLAQNCGFSAAAVSDALRGFRLPSWKLTAALLDTLAVPDKDRAGWRQRWLIASGQGTEPGASESPAAPEPGVAPQMPIGFGYAPDLVAPRTAELRTPTQPGVPGGNATSPRTSERRPNSVVLVGAYPLWRDAIGRDLFDHGVKVAATADDAESAARIVGAVRPDVVLMDSNLLTESGVNAIATIVRDAFPTRVLMLNATGEREGMLEAVRAGASGCLSIPVPTEELVDTVRRTAAGEAILTAELAELMLEESQHLSIEPKAVHAPRLTDRERDVLLMWAAGSSVAHVAARLMLSPRTVKSYMQSALNKYRSSISPPTELRSGWSIAQPSRNSLQE